MLKTVFHVSLAIAGVFIGLSLGKDFLARIGTPASGF